MRLYLITKFASLIHNYNKNCKLFSKNTWQSMLNDNIIIMVVGKPPVVFVFACLSCFSSPVPTRKSGDFYFLFLLFSKQILYIITAASRDASCWMQPHVFLFFSTLFSFNRSFVLLQNRKKYIDFYNVLWYNKNIDKQ